MAKVKSDIEIAQKTTLQPVVEIAEKLNIAEKDLEFYGKYKAKLPLNLIDPQKMKENHLVLVTAMTPTPPGEGKTTTTIGLTEGLNVIGKQAISVLREPSLGPVFGIKGGATGGGYSQVVPMEDINLHFTGDFSAIEKANNLLAALVDNNIQSKAASLGIDPRTVAWKRVMDMNDRALRNIICGLGGKSGGMAREGGFNITAASEIMAILCLANDIEDLKVKMGNIYVGETYDRQPVYARDLKAPGAMAALMKDAIKPNLVQTLEGNPAIIHGGPFANIAQGTNSVIATKLGLSLSKYVITEAGFGADLGAEKFLDIKCGYSGLSPQTIVLVATIRALKYHGGHDPKTLTVPDLKTLEQGMENLQKHLENIQSFGVLAVVSINQFITDSDEEVALVREKCAAWGVEAALAKGWELGGKGVTELAEKVVQAIERSTGPHTPAYDWNSPVETKIEALATKIYGARGVQYMPKAQADLQTIARLGLDKLPVCIAKTQNSLSDNPKLLGRPRDFELTVREIEISAGAGFLVPITGPILRMPGLPAEPAANHIDIAPDGTISGLF